MKETRQLHELARMMIPKSSGTFAGAHNLSGDYAMFEVLGNGTIDVRLYTPKRRPKRDGVFVYDPSLPQSEWHRRLASPGWLSLTIFR